MISRLLRVRRRLGPDAPTEIDLLPGCRRVSPFRAPVSISNRVALTEVRSGCPARASLRRAISAGARNRSRFAPGRVRCPGRGYRVASPFMAKAIIFDSTAAVRLARYGAAFDMRACSRPMSPCRTSATFMWRRAPAGRRDGEWTGNLRELAAALREVSASNRSARSSTVFAGTIRCRSAIGSSPVSICRLKPFAWSRAALTSNLGSCRS